MVEDGRDVKSGKESKCYKLCVFCMHVMWSDR